LAPVRPLETYPLVLQLVATDDVVLPVARLQAVAPAGQATQAVAVPVRPLVTYAEVSQVETVVDVVLPVARAQAVAPVAQGRQAAEAPVKPLVIVLDGQVNELKDVHEVALLGQAAQVVEEFEKYPPKQLTEATVPLVLNVQVLEPVVPQLVQVELKTLYPLAHVAGVELVVMVPIVHAATFAPQ